MSFRFCVIGCGGHAKACYMDPIVRYLSAHEDASLVSCCDMSPERAQAYAQTAGAQRWDTDWQAMVEREHPDAVLLLTPFVITAGIAVRLLEMGIPTLMEKPPGQNAAEAQRIADAYTASGTLHQIAFNRRHMPLIRILKQRLAAQQLRHIELRMHRVRRTENHFHTTAIHGIDLVCNLAGSECTQMHALYQTVGLGDSVINAQMLCSYENGVTAQLSFCPTAGLVCEQLVVAADHCTFHIDLPVWAARGNPGLLTQYAEDAAVFEARGDIEGGDMVDSNGFTHQLESFFADVRNLRQPADSILTGLDGMRLADCMAQRAGTYLL